MLVQRFILPFFNSPGDEDSKTHLTFLPTSKIEHGATKFNVKQLPFPFPELHNNKLFEPKCKSALLAGWSGAGDLRAGLYRDLSHHGPGAKEAGRALALGVHHHYRYIYYLV